MKTILTDFPAACDTRSEMNGRPGRFIGIDAGAETIKLVELVREDAGIRVVRRARIDHGKQPGTELLAALQRWGWEDVDGAAITGRFAGQVGLPQIPVKQAQLCGCRFYFGNKPVTLVNIGSHGFSVLELRDNGSTLFRENGRCSQGTGNFLRQLVGRFSLTVEEASVLCEKIATPAPLSGRCPVILKTDMTHLANKGEDRSCILAGLFDAVCENVMVLIKPGISPVNVLLAGGVSQSARVRRVLGEMLARQHMVLLSSKGEDALYIEALGCALIAAEGAGEVSSLDRLLLPPPELNLERLPSLADSLSHVHRLPVRRVDVAEWPAGEYSPHLVLGLDVGSTGSKIVAWAPGINQPLWEAYRQTLGNPVGAAQDLIQRFTQSPFGRHAVVALGATGSGREIAGSLLSSCYGKDAVFIVNEIVAHAAGALHFDARVDTIFEIGGQDAKYIRLNEGRIVDCAMNEACSAGTGSFIEEQGGKFAGISDVSQLGRAAIAAPGGVSLGQHCSVFMAEVIDEAVAAGIVPGAIISGLYDSIIKNYLNRVKGNRSVGKVIFCQGMPFSADALAAAVARQTGSQVIVPPNPGTVGALGIALLASRELKTAMLKPLDLQKFLEARVEQKDTFVCGSSHGCGGAGNCCRIERLRTVVAGRRSQFTWGGSCSLHDKGTRKRKLPDLAPDPFREREEWVEKLVARFQRHATDGTGRPRIALSDELMLKGLVPLFATFFFEAGFDLEMISGGGGAALKRGIQAANVPFCAPMQFFHGVAENLFAAGTDWVFLPMLRSLPVEQGQSCAAVCPIVQSAPDLIRNTVCATRGGHPRLLAPVIDFDSGNFESSLFEDCGRQLVQLLGLDAALGKTAWDAGIAAQREFLAACAAIGRRTLEYCRLNDIVPVVALGRNYTLYNSVLNSNVPSILREQGAIGIPVDCLPLDPHTPVFQDMYWGYGQGILRAAHQVRRTAGLYALYCSNYSCGPDSFTLHFAAYVMEGKPFAVIETDGHSGDAGTKTRIEAFLHCVEEDRRIRAGGSSIPGQAASADARANNFSSVQSGRCSSGLRRSGCPPVGKLLVPYLGPASGVVAAIFRGAGVDAESLPEPDASALQRGRRHTSGKECLPMPLTLGSLLQRLEGANPHEHFTFLMPGTNGPCRFGVYNLLNQIVLDRLGWRDRVRIWSPKDTGYFDEFPGGTEVLMFAGLAASDLLLQAKLDVRPTERTAGAAERLHAHYHDVLLACLEKAAHSCSSLPAALWQLAGGQLFGIRSLLQQAGRDFAAVQGAERRPVVELAGEIYVRSVDFSNDQIIKKLEARGLRVHLAPKTEWINYCGYLQKFEKNRSRIADGFSDLVRARVERITFEALAPLMNWAPLPTPAEALAAAAPYVNSALQGEAVLTVGAPLHEWRHGQIDGVVNVGPLECMPTKIAEAQYHHLSEREGMLNLTLAFNGDPVNPAALDNFAFEVKARHRRCCVKHRYPSPVQR